MSEKTHKPTAHKLREARKKGDVSHSAELSRALVLVGCLIWLGFGMAGLTQRLMQILKKSITEGNDMELTSPQAALALLEPHLLMLFLPPLLLALFFGLMGDFLQVRGVFSLDPMLPKMERINPAEGFKRIFSLRTLAMLAFSLLKVILTLVAAALLFKYSMHELASLTEQPPLKLAWAAGWLLFKLLAAGALIHLLVSTLDVMFQKYDYLKRQRMSIEELRREFKENEGDPLMRSHRRGIARADAE